jgi:hypothetical protein
MAMALVYPEPRKHGGDRRSETFSSVSKTLEIARDSLSHARTVIREFGADSAAGHAVHNRSLLYPTTTVRVMCN